MSNLQQKLLKQSSIDETKLNLNRFGHFHPGGDDISLNNLKITYPHVLVIFLKNVEIMLY